jgi:phosphoserine aminotransferase
LSRAHNFCAGPAALPLSVLQRASEELLDWQGHGCSVMEMSHRSEPVVAMVDAAEASLRRLLNISDDYAVFFQQGGATQQFAAVPLNLCGPTDTVAQVLTGQWSKKAIAEAKSYAQVKVLASSEDQNFSYVPAQSDWQTADGAAYLHYCPNETIGGLAFNFVPEVSVPLVADMSSTILSQPMDVSQFGVIYAGAQKNIGPAGLVLMIVRRELLGRARENCPSTLNWQLAADNGSMYNTPPTFSIYLAGLVFEWLEAQGGLTAVEAMNRRKADKLYGLIDASPFYHNPINPPDRSRMNVPFTLADSALDDRFLVEADAAQLLNLKGHRSVGGMRASIYNAVSEASVAALCDFMADFERRHG